MAKRILFGILYVSALVVIWGSIGSFIDYPLLKANIYSAGSIGQITTFIITALITAALGRWLFPKLSKNNIVVAALGLDSDKD